MDSNEKKFPHGILEIYRSQEWYKFKVTLTLTFDRENVMSLSMSQSEHLCQI